MTVISPDRAPSKCRRAKQSTEGLKKGCIVWIRHCSSIRNLKVWSQIEWITILFYLKLYAWNDYWSKEGYLLCFCPFCLLFLWNLIEFWLTFFGIHVKWCGWYCRVFWKHERNILLELWIKNLDNVMCCKNTSKIFICRQTETSLTVIRFWHQTFIRLLLRSTSWPVAIPMITFLSSWKGKNKNVF